MCATRGCKRGDHRLRKSGSRRNPIDRGGGGSSGGKTKHPSDGRWGTGTEIRGERSPLRWTHDEMQITKIGRSKRRRRVENTERRKRAKPTQSKPTQADSRRIRWAVQLIAGLDWRDSTVAGSISPIRS